MADFHAFQENGGIPVKVWTNPWDLESGAREQLVNASRLPIARKFIAAMPDVHQGYGLPVGGVMATDPNYIVPYAIGVDIGCGMNFRVTNVKYSEIKDRVQEVTDAILASVPVGKGKYHSEPHKDHPFFDAARQNAASNRILDELQRAQYQIGTLGGGNHFIELQISASDSDIPVEDRHVCIMVHSGSRNLGFRIANTYSRIAREECEKWHTPLPSSDLAFLPLDTDHGNNYLELQAICVEFARANRQLIARTVLGVLQEFASGKVEFSQMIDIPHNYAMLENHGRQKFMVHRKGAVAAYEGKPVIIPGSMETRSYVGVGKGFAGSMNSCSHGAGRRMSRTAARDRYDESDVISRMERSNIAFSSPAGTSRVDESAGAYKDIDIVLNNQDEMVHITDILRPIGVVKG